MDHIDQPRADGDDRGFSVWTPEDYLSFVEFVSRSTSRRWFPLNELAITTGARRGELLGLTWTNVDLDAKTIRLAQSRVCAGYRAEVRGTKTNLSKRVVSLSEQAMDALRRAMRQQQEDQALFAKAWANSGFVFTKPDGTPPHPDTISKRFAKDVKDSGVRRIRLHDLRHTFATTALAAGENPKAISEALGHKNIEIALTTYSHVLPGIDHAHVRLPRPAH